MEDKKYTWQCAKQVYVLHQTPRCNTQWASYNICPLCWAGTGALPLLGPFLILRLLSYERQHQPNYGNLRSSTTGLKPPRWAKSLCEHKWGYCNVRPACKGVNLWKCCYQIRYQSQHACCFKPILVSPGKVVLSKSPEEPSNVSPSATWSITDRVMQLPVLSTLHAQQGHSY